MVVFLRPWQFRWRLVATKHTERAAHHGCLDKMIPLSLSSDSEGINIHKRDFFSIVLLFLVEPRC